jgi:ribonuclease VapC
LIAVDTSALCAILWAEPEQEILLRRLNDAQIRLIAIPTLFEAFVVCARRRSRANARAMMELVRVLDLQRVAMDDALLSQAQDGFLRFGQGLGGTLNFGDCFSYAVAKSRKIPLLYKGRDFDQTDVTSAVMVKS